MRFRSYLKFAQLLFTFLPVLCLSQTTVTTTGGTANYVAKFNGSSTIVNSAIVETGGNVGIGLSNPAAVLTILKNTYPNTNTLIGAGFYTNAGITGNRNFWVQQWMNSLTARTFILGNGFVSGTTAAAANDGPYTKFEALEFQDGYFGFVRNSGGTITPALTVDPVSGRVGVGTTTPGQALEVNGGLKLTSGSGGGITFTDGTVQTTAGASVTPGSGLTTCGTGCISVDSTVARNNASNTFSAQQNFAGDVSVGGVLHATNLVAAIHGSCLTNSFSTSFVLNGLGQAKTSDCTYGPGTPTFNPALGSVVPFAGTLKGLQSFRPAWVDPISAELCRSIWSPSTRKMARGLLQV